MKMRFAILPVLFTCAFATTAQATLPLSMEGMASVAASARGMVGEALTSKDSGTVIAVNQGADAQKMIEKLGDRAMSAITDESLNEDKKKQVFRQLLSQNFDMSTIGRFAMGRYWRQATPAQQKEYLNLYEKMVIDVYTNRFNKYSGQQFNVTGNRLDASGDAVVSSQVTGGNGSPVQVDWRVRSKGGAPKIIDVMVEGVSMAVTQRNDFAGVIQQGGGNVDALIAYLKKGGTSDVDE